MSQKSYARVAVKVSNVKMLGGKTKIAVFSAELPSGTVLHQLLLERTQTKDDYTVVPPRIPLLNAKGEVVRDGAGRVITEPMLSFTNAEARSVFQHSIFRAIIQQYPTVFVSAMSRSQTDQALRAARAKVSVANFDS